MAAKKILLLIESDRNTFPLLGYLTKNARLFKWKIKIGTMSEEAGIAGLKAEPIAGDVEFLDLKKYQDCEQAIRKTDLIIAMVSDTLLLQVADSCIAQRKTLISPARLTRQMALKKSAAKESNSLILMDCGLSPGLDHIIAKKAIDNIHLKGGRITSFKTYSGTFISATNEPNPWDFKLTENAADVLAWGRQNNRYLVGGRMQHVSMQRLFERSEPKHIEGAGNIVAIPEGDSLYYKKIYNLADAHTVVKGKFLREGIDRLWNVMIKLGLMDTSIKIDMAGERSLEDIVDSLLPYSCQGSIEEKIREYTGASRGEVEKLKWLGLTDPAVSIGNFQEATPSAILQLLLERKLALLPDDRDAVVMEHHISYELRDESQDLIATLILRGESAKDSALARVIGYTCGAAAKSVLLGSIKTKGLHIPILREIYDPILNELEELGIAFQITERKPQAAG